MKALKMALALAFVTVTPVIAPTSASANEALAEESGEAGGRYICYYRYSFISGGTQYNVYQCYPIYA